MPLYAEGPPHKSWFISEAADDGYIVGPQKKSVAIYAMEEERLQKVYRDMNPEKEILLQSTSFHTGIHHNATTWTTSLFYVASYI